MKYLKRFLLVALCCLAVGCTATKQNAATTEASTEWRMQSLEESFLNFREELRKQADKNAAALAEIDKKLADLEAKMAEMPSEAVMAEPVEVTDAPEDKGWVSDLKPEEGKWVESGKPKEEMVAQSDEEKPWNKPPTTPAEISEPKVVERKPVKKAAPKPMVKKKPAKSGAQMAYDKAYATYNRGDYKGARSAFDAFMKKYPKSKLVPNAIYWKGETYYSEKNYPQAILTFKEVTGSYPKHAKAAASLLKIGMSYDKVGDSDNAVFYLRALVEDFPSSSPARLARKELNRLGG